ncbi:MAG: phosphoribosylformylglycinamidine cyclo-ligase [Candidatus Kapabacteria bacterium]|nr:phosphoribosylformylglycinamidine cyclo-ligase [Ignavibacteriota bacterium]MCW5885155.1 phosphoribosylformylglycinamidine cyclo-ligase [Candidatus Kapabacteria bacterium]
MSISYKDSGVDILAGEETVDRIKPLVKSTHNDKVLSNIGLFGGFYDASFKEYEHPILVASTDGVGTKLKVAFMSDYHKTIGQCLVNHCVNDILCCGAKPLFFLDYFATGKLNPDVTVDVIEGFVTACKENETALIGGETAEMPSMYNEGEYDVSGTIIGVVDKKNIVNGTSIKKGDVLIGLKSTGLHTNGYSLARAVLFPKYNVNDFVNHLDETVGEALLKVHKSYLKYVLPLVEMQVLTGISHITGGGLIGNTSRIMPDGLSLNIDWNSWKRPAIFELIQEEGNISEEEMRAAFNLGIGMVLVTNPGNVELVVNSVKEYEPVIIGDVK